MLQRSISNSVQTFPVIHPPDTFHFRFLYPELSFRPITFVQIHPAVFVIFKQFSIKFLLMVSQVGKQKMQILRSRLDSQFFLKLPDRRLQKILARGNMARRGNIIITRK